MKRTPLAVVALVALASTAGAQESPIRKRTAYEDLQMFSQVLNQIRVNHPDSVDTHKLFMAAVEGMVAAADPHSYVLPATRLAPEKEKEWRAGKLVPVPIQFHYSGGAPVVSNVAPGSAASRLDILPGDELLEIDGEPVRATHEEELAIVLAGRKGTTVVLTLERRRADGSRTRLARTVKREQPDESTAVPVALLLDDTTGYLRVTTFQGSRVADDVHDALRGLEKSGMKRLVLDLRGNGGGRVDQAADVAGEFLPRGAIVYTSEGRKAEITDTARVRRSFWSSEKRYPIVVLVDHGTASAAEFVAGALQDHDRALIVGRPTFGKSLLMQGFPMADGSMIVLVIGHIKTPCGRVVQRQYRDVSARDYYRGSREEREVAGRPSCTTTGGRTVYGGGGIFPDVTGEDPEETPLWLARVYEEDLPLRWAGGYVTENPALSLEELYRTPRLPHTAIEGFRAFAQQQGVAIPAGAHTDERLQKALLLRVASTRWASKGYYQILARLDPEVLYAMRQFERASQLPGASR